MTTQRQVRKAALGLVQAEEMIDGQGRRAFAVGGHLFAAVDPDQAVFLALPATEVDEMRSAYPAAQTVEQDGRRIGVRLALSEIDGQQQLNQWVRRAWASRAPRAVVADAAAAALAKPGEIGDLPPAIGRAATRALADLDVTSLHRVAGMTDRELLAIHGVGPRPVCCADDP